MLAGLAWIHSWTILVSYEQGFRGNTPTWCMQVAERQARQLGRTAHPRPYYTIDSQFCQLLIRPFVGLLQTCLEDWDKKASIGYIVDRGGNDEGKYQVSRVNATKKGLFLMWAACPVDRLERTASNLLSNRSKGGQGRIRTRSYACRVSVAIRLHE